MDLNFNKHLLIFLIGVCELADLLGKVPVSVNCSKVRSESVDRFSMYKKLFWKFDLLKIVPSNRPLPFFINSNVVFKFRALNKTFSLIRGGLEYNGDSVPGTCFTKNAQLLITSTNSTERRPISQFQDLTVNFAGKLLNDRSSEVYGRLTDDRFDGIIRSRRRIYFMERYSLDEEIFPKSTIRPVLVYELTDCLENVKNVVEQMQSFDILQDFIFINHENPTVRRDTSNYTKTEKHLWPKDCEVQVIVDHSFYTKVGVTDVAQTIFEVEIHFREVNRFLRRNDFNGDGKFSDLQFNISSLLIITRPPAVNISYDTVNYLNPIDYLYSITTPTFDKNCLIVLFTFLRFRSYGLHELHNNLQRRNVFIPKGACGICGLNVWIISFQGLEAFKNPRAISIIRMLSHIGILFGVNDMPKTLLGESSNGRNSSVFDSLIFSESVRRTIADNIGTGINCVSRCSGRDATRCSPSVKSNNPKVSLNYSQWVKRNIVRRHALSDEKNKTLVGVPSYDDCVQFVREWFFAPHPYSMYVPVISESGDVYDDPRRSTSIQLFVCQKLVLSTVVWIIWMGDRPL